KYSQYFQWHGRPCQLQAVPGGVGRGHYPMQLCNPATAMRQPVYRLRYYLPFTNAGNSKNYDLIKENANLPDIEKTKKLEQLLTNHLCSLIHYAGGYVPKKKIQLSILDKKPLGDIAFDGRGYKACHIRYTVNMYLPGGIGLGNKCSHGFGWQQPEM